ncbi:MAG: hypothetical protein ACMX3H_15670 [Sodalis sp. (in: enterobacteria)]|uniref:mannitol dehydrogenase family protein n=1 Tax=Sodalis sp. (in: enterobacteria) TaxID=1898979 RepID=UPI0039E410EC
MACEPFIQWVIEDNFVAGRPRWERAGAQLVNDVAPFEEMKLRMLNGSHSFLAWLVYLAGYPHISDCMNDVTLRAAVEKLMINEQALTLQAIEGVDTGDYARQLLTRFANPALKHRTWQIAMDSTQKLPQRILNPLRWHLRHGLSAPLLTLAVVGWMRYAGGIDEREQPIDIRDPLQSALGEIAARHEDGPARRRPGAGAGVACVAQRFRSGSAGKPDICRRGHRGLPIADAAQRAGDGSRSPQRLKRNRHDHPNHLGNRFSRQRENHDVIASAQPETHRREMGYPGQRVR